MAKNLVYLELKKCPSLTEVPSSLQYLDKLEELELKYSYNLRRFPMLDSKVLRVLRISRCLDVNTCPTISQNMKWLQLEETSIKEVPQSVASKLERLYLSGCPEVTKFPEISEEIEKLKLRGTAIKEVPSSIQFLTRLRHLDMSGCSKLESFPEITGPMKSLVELNLSKTSIKELPSSIQFLTRLYVLDMSGCSKLESFPEITVPMESLHFLQLSKTGIKEIPSSSFKHMISLRRLYLHGTPIKALRELPSSLQTLTTHDCASLETVTSIINISNLWLDFTNCFKLDQKPLVAAMHLKIQVSLSTSSFFLLSF
jgi:Leucine-rich repeat (LRR) protein